MALRSGQRLALQGVQGQGKLKLALRLLNLPAGKLAHCGTHRALRS